MTTTRQPANTDTRESNWWAFIIHETEYCLHDHMHDGEATFTVAFQWPNYHYIKWIYDKLIYGILGENYHN